MGLATEQLPKTHDRAAQVAEEEAQAEVHHGVA